MPLYLRQKKAIRIVGNVKHRDHTPGLFYYMKLLTIYQIIKLQTGIFIHKALHMKLPYNLPKNLLFERTDHEVGTRQNESFRKMYVPTMKKESLGFSY